MKKVKPRGPITAEQLMQALAQDPGWVARKAARDAEFSAREAALAESEAPLVAEIQKAGENVESVWDLVNTERAYPAAIPVLYEHLSKPYPPPIRDGIARALAVPQAKAYWGSLADLYRREAEPRVKDGLAVALCGAGDKTRHRELLEMTRDRSNGRSRMLLADALLRSRDQAVQDGIAALQDDPEIGSFIRSYLKARARRRQKGAVNGHPESAGTMNSKLRGFRGVFVPPSVTPPPRQN